jgi:hypothetical protein
MRPSLAALGLLALAGCGRLGAADVRVRPDGAVATPPAAAVHVRGGSPGDANGGVRDTGADDARDLRVTTSIDPWLETNDCSCFPDSYELPEEQFVAVPEVTRADAEKRLDWTPIVQLRADEVVSLTTQRIDRRAVLDAMARAQVAEAQRLEKAVSATLQEDSADEVRRGAREREQARVARERAQELKDASAAALHAYLVRGMALACSGRVNDVRLCAGRDVEVSSRCMGAHPSPASRAPVIVFLLHPPLNVCVRVTMAE